MLILLLPALLGLAAATEWRETMTPHFRIRHQNNWLPPGFTLDIERIHSRLRMDLGMFSPWMGRERLNLYVYRDQRSYVRGEFSPPAWSNGVALFDLKAVALPASPDRRKMLQVTAHETTHLLFEGFFRERGRQPPVWVNEGLAMLLEAESAGKPESSEWYQGMVSMDPSEFPPIERFLRVTPTRDMAKASQGTVGRWYVQAYSLVHFLLRRHSRLQFKSFCAELRDGRPAAEALWKVYRYRSLNDLDRRWRQWLADPAHRRRALAAAASRREDEAPGRGRRSSTFSPFRTGFERLRSRWAGGGEGR